MDRIIIIGCPGAGKSTFARTLRDLTGLPLIHLDLLWHKPDKTTVTREEFDASLAEVLSGERWIIDGNYMRTMELRLQRCTDVFLLDYPLEVCLRGALSRVGIPHDDLPWTENELDPEFRQWITDFPHEQLPQIYALLDKYKEEKTITIFHSREEAENRLREIENEGKAYVQ